MSLRACTFDPYSCSRPSESRSAMDMEVCTTLGMLSPEQAAQLKTAGLTAYNHNLDTSREYYPKVSSNPIYWL